MTDNAIGRTPFQGGRTAPRGTGTVSAAPTGAAEAERIARALGGAVRSGADWLCRCPAHADRNPSLALRVGDNGALVWRCHAGCTQDAVMDALRKLGLLADGDARGTDAGRARPNGHAKRRVVAAYDYTDERGALLFQVLRYEPKGFSQRRP